jgi:hypothetical protein
MRQPQAKSAVVGQKQQPFGVVVQPADSEQSRQRGRQQIEDAFPAVRVVAGAEHAGWFVEQEVNLAFDADRFSGNGDTIFTGIDLGAELSNRLAVDGNFALADERLAVAPRAEAGFGEKLLEPDEHYSGLVFGRPNTRWPCFQRPCFFRTSTRSKRFNTLRRAWILWADFRLECWDMMDPTV